MGKRSMLIYYLSDLVNKSETDNTETVIAKALLSIRNEIENWTLDDIAHKYFISQAGISRFIRKLGFKGFSELKASMISSVYTVERVNPGIRIDFDTAQKELYTQMREVAEGVNDLEREDLLRMASLLSDYKNIYFIGSELSMGILRLMQVRLLAMGKNVYTLFNLRYHNEILKKTGEEDLIVCVSMGERWFTYLDKKSLEKNKSTKVLWTCRRMHSCQELFDDMILFGDSDDPNLGYHYFMQFVLLLCRIL